MDKGVKRASNDETVTYRRESTLRWELFLLVEYVF